jgi:2-polyprenyl-6-methoxyphenol hydroxylase-like FAD-dependent oxidoreductase
MTILVQGQDDVYQQGLSPEGVTHLSQNRLLPMLLDSARREGAAGEVRFARRVRSVAQEHQGVRITVETETVNLLIGSDSPRC